MKKSANIWDGMARSFHIVSSRSKAHRDKYMTIAKLIIGSRATSVLDLGCGSGLLEKELIGLGYQGDVCAIDSSFEMLKIAKSMCGGKAKFIQMDLNGPISITDRFGVVVAINVLFFINDKQEFFNIVRRLLVNDDSLFILINPKPNNEASDWQFIKAHFSDTTIAEKVLIAINEIFNIPKYYKMIKGQRLLSKMASSGEIKFNSKDEIVEIAGKANLKVKLVEDIHAGQNWVFVMEKG